MREPGGNASAPGRRPAPGGWRASPGCSTWALGDCMQLNPTCTNIIGNAAHRVGGQLQGVEGAARVQHMGKEAVACGNWEGTQRTGRRPAPGGWRASPGCSTWALGDCMQLNPTSTNVIGNAAHRVGGQLQGSRGPPGYSTWAEAVACENREGTPAHRVKGQLQGVTGIG